MSDSSVTEKAQEAVPSNQDGKEGLKLPPEGGLRGWLCCAGSFICLFCTFGFLNAIGVFQTVYEQTILSNYTASDISWIFALQLCLMWAPGPIYGRLIDTYGPAPVLIPCSILCVFALCMTSLATEYYQIFLAQGLAFGIGSGGVFTSALICVGQWFVRQRGLATGIAAAGSSLGGVIFPIFLNKVMGRVGFYGAVRYAALFIGILLAASCFMVQARLPRKKWDPKARWFDFSLFKQSSFSFYTVGVFLLMWGIWAPFDYLPSMAQSIGFSPSMSLYLISIINASSVLGRTVPPHIGDRLGLFNVLTVSGGVTGISILALWLPFNYFPYKAAIIVFAIVFGFVSGSVVSLAMPCLAKMGTLETLGQRFGTFQLVIGLSCLTGLPILGAILNRQGGDDYSGLQGFSGGCCVLGSGFLAVATCLMAKQKQTWKV